MYSVSNHALNTLLDKRHLWRGRHVLPPSTEGVSTGFSELDTHLHLGGWPVVGSTEILSQQLGIGELWLLLPALAQRSQEGAVVWINPPCLPSPQALEQQGLAAHRQLLIRPSQLSEQLWAAEECLRSGACSAVLSWFTTQILPDKQLRRLHLAAQEGRSWHIHFRPEQIAQQVSPAPLRLQLRPAPQALDIEILKQRGGPAGQRLTLRRHAELYYQQRPPAQWPTAHHSAKTTRDTRRLPLLAPLPLYPVTITPSSKSQTGAS